MTGARVVIIGGGILGVSLLYHLIHAGWRDVVLVEKQDLTHGSTWHAAGLCTHFAHHPTIQALRARSVRLYRDVLPGVTGLPTGFHPTGALRITRNPERMDEFAHVAGLSAFTGHPLHVVSPEAIAALHPLARTDGILGGIHEPHDGHVDPALATQALAAAAEAGGAAILRRSPVTGIRHENGAWIVEAKDERFRARHLVNAAGTWSWEVGRMMGIDVPSVPILHQYLVLDGVDALRERRNQGYPELPIIRDPEESWYARQERDGFILGPYEADALPWAVDGVPEEFGADLLPGDFDRVADIVELAMARIPALSTGGLRTIVNGPITFSPDANPLIGPVAGPPNAWLLTGSSMGVMEGGGAGWLLAEWMVHGVPPLDALTVDPRRFGQWSDRGHQVAKAIECFEHQFAIHFPREERPAGRNRRRSPIHDRMAELGAVFGTVNGWERPIGFRSGAGKGPDNGTGPAFVPGFRRTGWHAVLESEIAAVHKAVGVADLSALAKFEITGPDTAAFLDSVGANRVPRPGWIGLTHALTSDGGVQSEFAVARVDETRARLTSAAAAEQRDEAVLRERSDGFDVAVRNVTEAFGVLAITGPRSRDLLDRLSELHGRFETPRFPWRSCRVVNLAGFPVLALRLSFAGELGWELHAPTENLPDLLLAIEAAGVPLDLRPFGAHALDAMRLEKGFCGWGTELTTERTLLEAGLGRFVDRRQGRCFIGREAMFARESDPRRWALVLLVVRSAGTGVDPFYAHSVYRNDEPVGLVTSGAFGFRTGTGIAFAWMRDRTAHDGLSVEIIGERIPARVCTEPPFDPNNTRLRA